MYDVRFTKKINKGSDMVTTRMQMRVQVYHMTRP